MEMTIRDVRLHKKQCLTEFFFTDVHRVWESASVCLVATLPCLCSIFNH